VPVAQVIEKSLLESFRIQSWIVTLGKQGKKNYQEKLFNSFQLSARVPETNFMGHRKINTIELEQANKVMHLTAIAYNLKNYLKFVQKRSKSCAVTLALPALPKSILDRLFGGFTKHLKLASQI